jgi:hypothetical protein
MTTRKRQPSMTTTPAAFARHRALSETLGETIEGERVSLPFGDVHEGLLDAADDPSLRPVIEQKIREASERRAVEVSKVKAENGRKGGWRRKKELERGKQ